MAPKNGVPKTYVKYRRVPRRTRSPDGRGCPVTRYPGIPVSRFPGIPVSRPPKPNRKSQIRKSAIADLLPLLLLLIRLPAMLLVTVSKLFTCIVLHPQSDPPH